MEARAFHMETQEIFERMPLDQKREVFRQRTEQFLTSAYSWEIHAETLK